MKVSAPLPLLHLDAVEAYERIAPEFGRLSDGRWAYLERVEQLVASGVPLGSCSLLDVGAGDGGRAIRIAQATGIEDVVLLEPSAGMRRTWPRHVRAWTIRAEELAGKNESFDVITCLWNVLGHISPVESRVEVLRQCGRLLTPHGLIFLDVNHRYNARHYGMLRTLVRMARDGVRPGETNGDVRVRWDVDGRTYATDGHVFTHGEFCRDVRRAKLAIKKWFSVDYGTGAVRRWRFAGNLLYVLQRGA